MLTCYLSLKSKTILVLCKGSIGVCLSGIVGLEILGSRHAPFGLAPARLSHGQHCTGISLTRLVIDIQHPSCYVLVNLFRSVAFAPRCSPLQGELLCPGDAPCHLMSISSHGQPLPILSFRDHEASRVARHCL
jgi:hypothetical protein